MDRIHAQSELAFLQAADQGRHDVGVPEAPRAQDGFANDGLVPVLDERAHRSDHVGRKRLVERQREARQVREALGPHFAPRCDPAREEHGGGGLLRLLHRANDNRTQLDGNPWDGAVDGPESGRVAQEDAQQGGLEARVAHAVSIESGGVQGQGQVLGVPGAFLDGENGLDRGHGLGRVEPAREDGTPARRPHRHESPQQDVGSSRLEVASASRILHERVEEPPVDR
jgi:hypothetical protein